MSLECLKLFSGFLWHLKIFKNLFTRACKTLYDPALLIFSTSYFLTCYGPTTLDFFLFHELAKFSFFKDFVLVFPLFVLLFLLIIMRLVLSCNSKLILSITSSERFSPSKVAFPTSTKLLCRLLPYLFPQ